MRVSPFLFSALLGSGILIAGCAGDASPDFDSLQSTGRIKAAVNAAAERDEQAVPELIVMLVSDDPAERLIGIASLKRITGQTLGYDPAAPEGERQLAVARWTAYVAQGTQSDESSVGDTATERSQLGSSSRQPNADLPDGPSEASSGGSGSSASVVLP